MRAGDVAVNGRMVRTARYKYCLFDRGARRESLFDEMNDPLEMVNLAGEPGYAAELEQPARTCASMPSATTMQSRSPA